MVEAKDRIRADREQLIAALREAGAVFKGREIGCPFHDDRHPSGNVYQDEDGVWRFMCMTPACGWCGDVFDIRAKVTGKSVEDQLRELQDHAPRKAPPRVYPTAEAMFASKGSIEALYRYTDPITRLVDLIVARLLDREGRKTFLQGRPNPAGEGFILGAPPKPWPLYNRTRLQGAKRVIFCEGEKCVHMLTELGIVATTSPGGSANADNADYRPLAGIPEVIIWPDHDAPNPKTGRCSGTEYGKAVAAHLQQLTPAPRILWLDPVDLGLEQDGSDVVDFIAEYGGDTVESKRKAVEAALSLASPLGAAQDLYELLSDTIAGKRPCHPFPWSALTHLTRALMNGTVTVICGAPGSSKSLLILHCCWTWNRHKIRVAVLMLEEDKTYHLQRVLAQLDNNSDLTDPSWIQAHPQETLEAWERHRAAIEAFAPCISTAGDKAMTQAEVITWAKERAEAGCKIIVVDPITAADCGDAKPWVADQQMVLSLKAIARTHGAALILVSHPRKSPGKSAVPNLDGLAGGAAFQRFASTILWIQRPDQAKKLKVKTTHGTITTDVNRIIRLMKTRNGKGAGLQLGYTFEGDSLQFAEQGILVAKGADEDTTPDPFSEPRKPTFKLPAPTTAEDLGF